MEVHRGQVTDVVPAGAVQKTEEERHHQAQRQHEGSPSHRPAAAEPAACDQRLPRHQEDHADTRHRVKEEHRARRLSAQLERDPPRGERDRKQP